VYPLTRTSTTTVARVGSAGESNALAARRGLWAALDTLECGRPEVVRDFFADAGATDAAIVDIGCWNGSIAALAAESLAGGEEAPWRSYTGVDAVPEAVERFREAHARRRGTAALVGDARALPFADSSADVVLCLFVLQDLPDRAAGVEALAELVRVARAGARALVALTVHETRDEETFYVVRKLRAEGVPEKPTYHWRKDDFLAAVASAGFELTRLDEFGPNERGFCELYLHLVRR
jgi:SAM-dependent methyltransferase